MPKPRKPRHKRLRNPAASPRPGARKPPTASPADRPVGAGAIFPLAMPPTLPTAALALMVLLAYWPALFGGFVWDDNTFIVADKQVGSLAGLWHIWFKPASMAEFHYWPVLYSAFWLEHKLWGFNPLGFHAVNLVLHGVNTVLLWRLLARMRVPGDWLVAAVFALHPAHVEAVAWVIARKDLLATFFYLLAFAYWLRYQERPRIGAYLALLALYAVGALSKSVALSLPMALLLWAWWRQGCVTKQDATQVMPLFLLGFAIAAFDLHLFTAQAVHEFEYSFAERLIIASKALWFYAGKLLWPQPLLFMYPHWDVAPGRLLNWLPLAAALALALGLWMARHRWGRGPLAGALFFALALSPVLGFADFGYMKFSFVADRYQYLPSIGPLAVLIAAAALTYRHLAARVAAESALKHGARAMAALLLLAYGVLSFERTHVFQTEIGLFRHIVATNPQAPSAWFNLGTLLMKRDPEEAVAAFRAALERYPDDTQIHINLGSALLDLNRAEEAAAVLRAAIPLAPDDFEAEKAPRRARHLAAGAHYNLGNALLRLQREDEAEQSFRRALEVDPANAQARASLVAVLQGRAATRFAAGRYGEALALYRQCIAIAPDNAEAHSNLGSVLGQMGRFQEAAQSFERALAFDPQMETARANLRVARERLRKQERQDGND